MGKRDIDFRWADAEQASSRLRETFVLYGDDVFYVSRIEPNANGGLSARGHFPLSKKNATYPLEDENFHGFRKLPPLGWSNLVGADKPMAVYMRRIPARSNGHGLKNSRVSVYGMEKDGWGPSRGYDYNTVTADQGYKEMMSGIFPTPSEIMENLRVPSVVAFSRLYAIRRNQLGEFTLYRRGDFVGSLSSGEITIGKGSEWCREELEETIPRDEIIVKVR